MTSRIALTLLFLAYSKAEDDLEWDDLEWDEDDNQPEDWTPWAPKKGPASVFMTD